MGNHQKDRNEEKRNTQSAHRHRRGGFPSGLIQFGVVGLLIIRHSFFFRYKSVRKPSIDVLRMQRLQRNS